MWEQNLILSERNGDVDTHSHTDRDRHQQTHIETETDTERDRQTEWQTERNTKVVTGNIYTAQLSFRHCLKCCMGWVHLLLNLTTGVLIISTLHMRMCALQGIQGPAQMARTWGVGNRTLQCPVPEPHALGSLASYKASKWREHITHQWMQAILD